MQRFVPNLLSHFFLKMKTIFIDGQPGKTKKDPKTGTLLSEDYAEIVDEEGDYSTPATKDYELVRNQIELGDILGEGQFGDVHKGTYRARDGSVIPVAVKTCKVDADLETTEKFLEEACKYYERVRSFPLRLLARSRYHAAVRSSAHHQTDRRLLRFADMDRDGTRQVRRAARLPSEQQTPLGARLLAAVFVSAVHRS